MRLTSVQVVVGAWFLLIAAGVTYNLTQQAESGVLVHATTTATEILTGLEIEPVIPCEEMTVRSGEKTIVLRVDDVQGWAWASTTRAMITDAEARQIPLTLGIIPKNILDDTDMVSFLRARACNHEFALHGFDHANHGPAKDLAEFEDVSHGFAKGRIEKGLAAIAQITDEPVRTWIPPLNRHSTGTQQALDEFGFTRLSTEGEALWDYDAATFTYDNNALTPTEKVIADCAATFEVSDVCIIMLHPQDFTTDDWHDAEKYQAYYVDLLDVFIAEGYGFGTFASVDVK